MKHTSKIPPMTAVTPLSLCMIVKDEADHLPACLKSVKGLVDEIVVIDTGSKDRTPEIAESFGARIYVFPWKDDFSAARNVSLGHATGDWILVLDADEVVASVDHAKIRNFLKDKTAWGFTLEQRSYGNDPNFKNWITAAGQYPEENGYGGYIASPLIRLFRNNERIRFEGPVHELVEPCFSRLGLPTRKTTIPIHHYGKVRDPARLSSKARLYMQIGRKKTAANPENAKAQSDLGAQYIELEDYHNALKAFHKVTRLCPDDPDAFVDLGVCYLRQGQLAAAEKALSKAIQLNPDHTDAIFNLGAVFLHQQRYESAENLFEKLITICPDHGSAYGALGSVILCRNRPEEAIFHLSEAIRLNKGDADLYSNLAWACARTEWPKAAQHYCQKALSIDPGQINAQQIQKQTEQIPQPNTDLNLSESLNREGETLFKQASYEAAKSRFHQACAAAPLFGESWNNLGVCYWISGQKDRALPYFLRAFLIDSDNTDTVNNLMSCCRDLNRKHLLRFIENNLLNGFQKLIQRDLTTEPTKG